MSERGDLEIVLACAQASEAWKEAHKWYPTMTLDPTFSGVEIRGEHCYLVPNNPMRQGPQIYDPLHDDAQAMALAKRFKLQIAQLSVGCKVFTLLGKAEADDADLNRAICLCVANLSRAG